MSVFAFSPIFASASNGKGKSEEKRQEKQEKRIEKQEKKQEKQEKKLEKKISKNNSICWNKFFYRLVPFGWVKNNFDSINLDDLCSFGVQNPRATSTPDTTAPTISNIASKTGHTRALIIWNTNEKTSGKVFYSTSSPVDVVNGKSASVNKQILGGKDHYLLLNNLATGTTYYFVVEAKDRAGNTSRSGQSSFTTKGSTVVVDVSAPLISSVGTSIGTSTVNVSWSTNEVATSRVYYSTTTPINKTLANLVQSSALTTSHNLKIENLSTSTTYYLSVESADPSANLATSSEFSITTASGI